MSVRRVKSSSKRSQTSLVLPIAQQMGELEKAKQEGVAMKSKIRSLELEVDTLKQRLDSLRKAKNTTIIKREREEIRIQSPNLGRHHSLPTRGSAELRRSVTNDSELEVSSSVRERQLHEQLIQHEKLLEDKTKEIEKLTTELLSKENEFESRLTELEQDHDKTLNQLKRTFNENEERLQQELKCSREINVHVQCTATEDKDELLKELKRLQSENKELSSNISDLIEVNKELRESNFILQGKCETLLEDLSVKEAQWAEREDRLHAEIRKQWSERYHEWITKAEKKMEELQKVNAILQSVLKTKAHNPDL